MSPLVVGIALALGNLLALGNFLVSIEGLMEGYLQQRPSEGWGCTERCWWAQPCVHSVAKTERGPLGNIDYRVQRELGIIRQAPQGGCVEVPTLLRGEEINRGKVWGRYHPG